MTAPDEPANPYAPPAGAPRVPAAAPPFGQPPYGQPAYGQPAYPGQAPYPGPYPYPGGWGVAPVLPQEHLRRAAAAVRQAPPVLWSLLVAYALLAVNGLTGVLTHDEPFASDLYEGGETVGGLAVLAFLASSTWLWAVLGTWCSHVKEAARKAGNLPGGASLSGLAWGGVFIPTGIVWAPFLAYRNALRYTAATARVGRLTGAGEGWRATPLPDGFVRWWVLHGVATTLYGSYVVVVDEGDFLTEGLLMLAAAAAGGVAAVAGARFWTQVARTADQAAA